MSNMVIYLRDGALYNDTTKEYLRLTPGCFQSLAGHKCLLVVEPQDASGRVNVLAFNGDDYMKLAMYGVFRMVGDGLGIGDGYAQKVKASGLATRLLTIESHGEDFQSIVVGLRQKDFSFDKPSTVMPQQDTIPSTLNSRTLLDKVLSSTDPDLQGELEGLSFRVVRGREKYGTEDETYDDGTTDYVVLTAQDGEEKAIRLLEVLKSDVVDFTGLPRWTGGNPRKELGSAGFCARALAKAYQNRGHIVYSHGHVGNGEPVKAVACMPPSGFVALGVIYQPPEVGTWGEDKSRTAIYDAKFDNFFSGEPVGGEEMFYNDVDAFKKWLGNPMQGAKGVQESGTAEDTVSETPTRVFVDLKTSEFLDRVLTSLQQSGDISGTYEGVEFAVRRSVLTGAGKSFYGDGTDDYIELYDKESGTCSSARLFDFFNADLTAYPIEYSKWLKFTNRKAMPGPAARAICAAYMYGADPESSNSVALQEKFNPSSNEVSGAPTEFTATVTDEGDTITLKVSQGHLTQVFSATFGGFFSTPDVESIHVSNTGK